LLLLAKLLAARTAPRPKARFLHDEFEKTLKEVDSVFACGGSLENYEKNLMQFLGKLLHTLEGVPTSQLLGSRLKMKHILSHTLFLYILMTSEINRIMLFIHFLN
jgi:hypothetical protein